MPPDVSLVSFPDEGHGRMKAPVRLKRRRLIRALFDRTRSDVFSVAAGCVRIVYRIAERSETGIAAPVQAGVSAGRSSRSAVRRNRIKRLLREVYRVHHHVLVDLFSGREDTLTLMVIFRGRPEEAEHCIRQHLPGALQRLATRLQGPLNPPPNQA